VKAEALVNMLVVGGLNVGDLEVLLVCWKTCGRGRMSSLLNECEVVR